MGLKPQLSYISLANSQLKLTAIDNSALNHTAHAVRICFSFFSSIAVGFSHLLIIEVIQGDSAPFILKFLSIVS